MFETNKIYHGDCRNIIPNIDDQLIDLVITSPPYNVNLGENKYHKNPYDLYNDNKDHQDYIRCLVHVFTMLYDKMKKGGRVCINIGDGKNGCYDDQTEILTIDGWKFFSELNKKDKVMTLNPNNLNIEYENPSFIQVSNYNGNMYYFNSYTLDLVVTPNHRMYVEKHHTKGFNFVEAQKCNQRQYKLPRSIGKWVGRDQDFVIIPGCSLGHNKSLPDLKINMDHWMEFMGWYVTEGCVNHTGRGYRVTITQSKEKNLDNYKRIIKLLHNMNIDFYTDHKKNIRFSDKRIYQYLLPLGKAKDKYIPFDLLFLSQNKLKLLFNTLIDGDGCRHNNGQNRFYTSSKKLADQVQEIALKIGLSSRINVRNRESHMYEGREIRSILPSYDLTFTNKPYYTIDTKRNLNIKKYNGKIYCCSTRNGIVYVRRNGTSVWCGNSVPTASDITQFMVRASYIPYTHIIWDKSQVGNRCAWGSFMSPSAPSFPTPFEHILVFAKETKKLQYKGETDLTKQEFIDWSLALWKFAPETRQKAMQHNAMFPPELVHRLVKMLSYKDAIVLDPFSGMGTTALVAKALNRRYIGIELSEDYCCRSRKRIENEVDKLRVKFNG